MHSIRIALPYHTYKHACKVANHRVVYTAVDTEYDTTRITVDRQQVCCYFCLFVTLLRPLSVATYSGNSPVFSRAVSVVHRACLARTPSRSPATAASRLNQQQQQAGLFLMILPVMTPKADCRKANGLCIEIRQQSSFANGSGGGGGVNRHGS